MKIQINENESYEINLPDIITIKEFLYIVNKVSSIAQNNQELSSSKEAKRRYVKSGKYCGAKYPWTQNRDKAVELVKLHYFGEKEKKEQIARSNNISWYDIVKSLHNLKKRFDIKPQEIGLREFPPRGGSRELKILGDLGEGDEGGVKYEN